MAIIPNPMLAMISTFAILSKRALLPVGCGLFPAEELRLNLTS